MLLMPTVYVCKCVNVRFSEHMTKKQVHEKATCYPFQVKKSVLKI